MADAAVCLQIASFSTLRGATVGCSLELSASMYDWTALLNERFPTLESLSLQCFMRLVVEGMNFSQKL